MNKATTCIHEGETPNIHIFFIFKFVKFSFEVQRQFFEEFLLDFFFFKKKVSKIKFISTCNED